MKNGKWQGMRYKFGSAGAVCSVEDSSGPQNLQVSILLKASKSADAKGDVSKIYGFVHPGSPMVTHSLNGYGLS